MYGKMENGRLRLFTGRKIVHDGKKIINPKKANLAALGYKPVVDTEAPEVPEGMALSLRYIDEGDVIRAHYELVGGHK